MVQSNITIIVIFVIYLAMMLAIGLIAYKKTSNTEDYFLGGRKLGSWVVSLSASIRYEWMDANGTTGSCIYCRIRSRMDCIRINYRDLF